MGIVRMGARVMGAAAVIVACGGGGDGGTGPGIPTCAAPGGTQVRLCSASFNPTSITISRNGTVTWNNTSGVLHNVTFAVDPVEGDIGNHSTGTNTRTFATAGTFSYSCTNHSGMDGTVTVNP